MPWTTPTDRLAGYTVTAADWNVVQDDLTFLNATLRLAGPQNWSAGFFIQFGSIVFTAAAGGTTITFPTAYASTVPIVMVTGTATTGAAGNVVTAGFPATLTTFTVFVFNGGTLLTSGSARANYIAIGI